MQLTKAISLAQIAALRTSYAGAILHLYTGTTNPNLNSVTGDFTEANFSGYSAATVTAWEGVYWSATASTGATRTGEFEFSWAHATPPALDTPNDVTGWYLTTSGGTLIAAERFDQAISVANVGDVVFLNVVLYGPPTFQPAALA